MLPKAWRLVKKLSGKHPDTPVQIRGGLQQFPPVYTDYAPLIRAYLLLTLLRTSGPQALLAGGGTSISYVTPPETCW